MNERRLADRFDALLARARAQDWVFTLAVAFVALLPRLFVAIAWAREPVWDGHYYHFGAERIAEGLGYSEDVVVDGVTRSKPWSHYPVGYSALLAVAYKLFGSGLQVAPLVNAVIGAALAVVAHRLGRHYLSENRARLAAALVALHPGLIAYTAVVMTEPLAALLLLAAALAWRRFDGSYKGAAASGAALGLAALVRPSSLLVLLFLPLLERDLGVRALKRGAVCAAIALVTVLPWTVRNCVVMDGCALVSTNGGWNLAIGALTETGRFTTLRAADGCPVVTGQVQQDRCWAEVGRRAIARDPARYLALAPKKLSQTYDHESFAIEYLREANPAAWPEARRQAGRELLTLAHRGVLALAAFGAVGWAALGRRRAWLGEACAAVVALGLAGWAFASDDHPFYAIALAIPLLAVVPRPGRPAQGPVGRYLVGLLCATTITHAVFFGDDRYHLVVTPALCLLAAAALRRPDETGPHEP